MPKIKKKCIIIKRKEEENIELKKVSVKIIKVSYQKFWFAKNLIQKGLKIKIAIFEANLVPWKNKFRR